MMLLHSPFIFLRNTSPMEDQHCPFSWDYLFSYAEEVSIISHLSSICSIRIILKLYSLFDLGTLIPKYETRKQFHPRSFQLLQYPYCTIQCFSSCRGDRKTYFSGFYSGKTVFRSAMQHTVFFMLWENRKTCQSQNGATCYFVAWNESLVHRFGFRSCRAWKSWNKHFYTRP